MDNELELNFRKLVFTNQNFLIKSCQLIKILVFFHIGVNYQVNCCWCCRCCCRCCCWKCCYCDAIVDVFVEIDVDFVVVVVFPLDDWIEIFHYQMFPMLVKNWVSFLSFTFFSSFWDFWYFRCQYYLDILVYIRYTIYSSTHWT